MDFELILRSNSLKATHQRLSMLEIINRHGHIDLDSLYKKLHKDFPTISLATLYRNIKELLLNKILSEVKLPNQKNVFEITKQEHIHIVCSKCKSIQDYPISSKALIKDLCQSTSFAIDEVHLSLTGLCPKCQSS